MVAASVLLVLALVAGYARRAVVNSDQFANRATTALEDDSVRTVIAEKITDEVLEQEPDLIAARPLLESVTSAIVGSRAFTRLFRAAVRDVHRAVFARDKDTVTLTVTDVGTVLAAALERLRPAVAKDVESTRRVELLKRNLGSASADLARVADDIRLLAAILLVLALLAVGGALLLSADRRRTAIHLGVGAAAGGVFLVVAYAITRSRAIDQVDGPENRAAVGAIWDAFLRDLRTAAWILAGSGAIVAAAAASLIRPVDIREPLRGALAWVATEPERPALRVLRGVAFLASGLIVIVERDAVLHLALTLAGVFLIYEGVLAILRVIYRPPAPGQEPDRPVTLTARRRLAGPLLAACLIAAALAVFLRSGGTTTAAPETGACNGHAELCDRSLDRVALPSTHNAMSVPLPGWFSALQERPIPDQLADGVRGLLLDTHYADRLAGGKLRTYFGSQEELRRQARREGLSPDTVDAALRIRERLGFRGKGERGQYLCHTFCELGATTLESVLDEIRDFLVANPEDVLVVINQDYLRPEDFVAAVRKAGLEEFAFTVPESGRWPTLRQMIDTGRRVVFLAENKAGAAPWYQLAYKRITQETPYEFKRVSLLTDPKDLPASCRPNRGPAKAPIFLVNQWINTDPTPRPSNAAKVNAYEPLLRRARECQRIRERLPNLLAVDFYREGDLFRVVDTLNGVK